MIFFIKTGLLFILTALAEIIGCFLPYLWLRQERSVWLLVPAVVSLALFVWLLTLHPAASGRIYAAYGGVYIVASLAWMWTIEKTRPDNWDAVGAVLSIAGAAVILLAPRSA